MVRIAAGAIVTHVVNLVSFRDGIEIVVGTVDEPMEHLGILAALWLPRLPKVPVLV